MTGPVFVLPPGPHPSVPNVHDLTAEVVVLRRHLDVLVLALARAHGVSEATERQRFGLPPGNPWVTRRASQNSPQGDEQGQTRPRPPLTDSDAREAIL